MYFDGKKVDWQASNVVNDVLSALVVDCTTNDKHIPNHAIKPIEHHNEAIAGNKQIGNKCNRWRPCDALEVVKFTKCLYTSVKNGLS